MRQQSLIKKPAIALKTSQPQIRSLISEHPAKKLSELIVQAKTPLETELSKAHLPADKVLTLFLSFTDGLQRATVVQFSGKHLAEVWKKLADWQQRKFKESPKVRWLRIDWVTETRAMTWADCQKEMQSVKRNYFRYGISLDTHLRRAFLEQELNANAMLYLGAKQPKAALNKKNFLNYGVKRYGKHFSMPSPTDSVLLFTTQAILVQPDKPHELLHGYSGGQEGRNTGRRIIEQLDPAQVTSLIQQSSQFLADQVDAKGRFIYGIHPCFDREIKAYNTLRHTSTTYSMLEAWEVTKSSELKSAIDRSIEHLTSELIRQYTLPSGETLAYLQDDNNEIKLGGNAVCLLALVKYTELTNDQQYLPLMEQLALGIQRMQNQENGQLYHVLNADDLSTKEEFRIIYYDGEAAFGLMRLYGLTKDERWLNTVEKAFEYFIEKEHWKIHDHWLSYCVNELTLYRPEERYYQFGIKNVAGHLDFVIGRITTFPTLLELMMAAHKMITRLEASDQHRHLLEQIDLKKFYRALEARAHYLLNGFFWPEFAIYFQNPQRIMGSFFIRHHSFRVRIDDVEHYLSGYVAYLRHYLPNPYHPIRQSHTDEPKPGPTSTPTSPLLGSYSAEGVLAWGGDVNLGRRQHYRSQQLGFSQTLVIPELQAADLSMINLECVVSTLGEQGIVKGENGPYYYRARPEMLKVLTEAGIDVVTVANNHSGDYGPKALLQQQTILQAVGIASAGSGNNQEAAFTPVYCQAREVRVAVFSIDSTQHRFASTKDQPGAAYLPPDKPGMWQQTLKPLISQAKQQVDLVVIAVHWGANHADQPDANEIAIGHALIDAGADAILGASAHRLQGIEVYRNKPIIHDAGDLLFDAIRSDLADSGIFQLGLTQKGISWVRFVPVGSGFGLSQRLTAASAHNLIQRYAKKCSAMGTQLVLGEDDAYVHLQPQPQPLSHSQPSAQTKHYSLDALENYTVKESELTIEKVPEEARIEPVKLGPLTLLGIRVKPREITRRRMLWVESFWTCERPLTEDIRLNIQGIPVRGTTMAPWGRGMDHDPCDWMMPTSRWQPGLIYRDYYGLRPPHLRNLKNIDLQIKAGIVSQKKEVPPVSLPTIVRLAIPGKDEPQPTADLRQNVNKERCSFSSSELPQVIGGYWVYPPKEEVYVDYFVSGAGLVKNPRTCMVCMYYETWLKGTGNTGHYKNIFSDSHVSFESRYKKLQLQEKVNCLIVQRPIPEVSHIPQLVVENSYEALKVLAATARRKMADNGTVFAVTGAVGKSTTCDLLARCIQPFSNCIAMTNGHNSRTGVTIWTASLGIFDPKFEKKNNLPNTCVLEVAGSALWMKSGWTIKAVRPNISIITHIELTQYGASSKSIEDVAYFKSRVCEAMHKGGIVVLNRDMPLYEKVLDYVTDFGAKPYSYGISEDSNTRLLSYQYNLPTLDSPQEPLKMAVKANVLGEEVSYEVSAVGKPVALNSLAALTAAKLAGFDIQESSKQLKSFQARKNTLEIFVHKNVLILDCSHNLEIPSILAAFEILKASNFSNNGRRIVIMSRIVNMGDISSEFHLKLEEPFNTFGFDKLFIHNPNHEWDRLLPRLTDSFLGGTSTNAKGTIAQFMDYVQEGDSVLILGASRGCDFGDVHPGIIKGIEQKITNK
ncbi:CapA family protein [Vreelandella alkaliphila]|uniref:CapA family protein n=1 Tax=Vreelandella alkaliphila TaxID=272774 RepID=UPI003FD7873B